MSRSRNKRYYDDSDDMVERIRRAREAFEKKTNAFQGPDWPYYDKRIISGQEDEGGVSGGAGAGSDRGRRRPGQLRNHARTFATEQCPRKSPGDDRGSNLLMVGRSTRSSENLVNRQRE